ncbi:hypothetical protein M0R72_09800 [Candidatus Pacearchaeota archaeon]|jgi:hypothetical protein|nr:hypothetical protein [Candidatus Pacearchaeota archaeon]
MKKRDYNFSKKNIKGQMEISFGMIFSIILVIFFLAFGFYAIMKFIELQQSVQIETFLDDFQEDVNTIWKSPQGSQSRTYTLPTKITSVCITDDPDRNLEFTSEEIIPGDYIENLNIEKIVEKEDPFCVNNVKGKINFVISKEYGETLVTVSK